MNTVTTDMEVGLLVFLVRKTGKEEDKTNSFKENKFHNRLYMLSRIYNIKSLSVIL